MADERRTSGELLFEEYLKAMEYEYEFEKSFPERSKRPDYTVTRNGVFLFDVKDFDPVHPNHGFGVFDPYPPIREKINQAWKKFHEFKDYPCSLVLRNNGNRLVPVEDARIVLGAMYGDAGFTFPFDTTTGTAAGPLKHAFLGRGKMIRPNWSKPQNTTISAVVTLRYVAVGMEIYRRFMKKHPDRSIDEMLALIEEQYPRFALDERRLGVIVWENAFARIPLSRELFQGPFDERWGVDGNEQGVVFCGTKLAELKTDE